MAKPLRILHKALKIMENVLHSHTSTSRLGDHDEAIKYYMRAYEMRKQLSGSMKHFDMPFFKGQMGRFMKERNNLKRQSNTTKRP